MISGMNGEAIRIGLWGLGRAGKNMHAAELEHFHDLFHVTAVCDIIPERVREMEQRFHCKGYTDGKAFLADPSTEMVAIAVRSPEHVDFALNALQAGKIVFLEKPIAVTEENLKKLEQVVKDFPGRIYFRQNRRFEACFNHVREIIASGILGDVYEIKLRRHRYQAREDWQTILEYGGGQINNWGPHLIDHALRFLESPLKDVWSDFKTVASAGSAEDHIKVLFRGKNGRLVDLEISDGVLIPSNVYEVYGTRGTLISADETDLRMCYLDPAFAKPAAKSSPETPKHGTGYGNAGTWPWIRKTIPVHPANGYEMTDIYKYLYEAIRENKPFPVRSEEALDVVRTTLMLKKQNPAFNCGTIRSWL